MDAVVLLQKDIDGTIAATVHVGTVVAPLNVVRVIGEPMQERLMGPIDGFQAWEDQKNV